jgi:hypothetical protein
VATVGASQFLRLNRTIQTKEQLGAQELRQLAARLTDVRYVIFSRVDKEEISTFSHFRTEMENGKERGYQDYTTGRQIDVHIEIYDLRASRLAWHGVFREAAAAINTNPHKASSSLLEHLVYVIVDDALLATYPAPPSLYEVVGNGFQNIGRHFPRADCSEVGYLECVKQIFGLESN